MTTPTNHDLNVLLARLMGLEVREMPAYHSPEDGWITPTRRPEDGMWWFYLDCNQGEACAAEANQWRKGPWRPHYSLCWHAIPDWRGSLDALFAPGGPVEYAQVKHDFNVVLTSNDGTYEAEVLDRAWVMVLDEPVIKDSPAEALATALHEAFMKEQEQ